MWVGGTNPEDDPRELPLSPILSFLEDLRLPEPETRVGGTYSLVVVVVDGVSTADARSFRLLLFEVRGPPDSRVGGT